MQEGKSDDASGADFSFLDVYFEKASLLPAIVQEESTGEVLMLAYTNRESFQKTLETGYTWFWSRSRQELWNKGAHRAICRRWFRYMETATGIQFSLRWSRQARPVIRAAAVAFSEKLKKKGKRTYERRAQRFI